LWVAASFFDARRKKHQEKSHQCGLDAPPITTGLRFFTECPPFTLGKALSANPRSAKPPLRVLDTRQIANRKKLKKIGNFFNWGRDPLASVRPSSSKSQVVAFFARPVGFELVTSPSRGSCLNHCTTLSHVSIYIVLIPHILYYHNVDWMALLSFHM
jgi:hypothetical protein